MEEPINLIYIAGDVRSGTTVIDLLLSNHKQIISLGELKNLEDYIERKEVGRFNNWKCSCGKQLDQCVFWSKVIEIFHMNSEKKIKTKIRKNNLHKTNLEIANNCWEIIALIAKLENKKYVIDSSKNAIQLYYLRQPNNQHSLKVIYLIRDARAVTFSKAKWEQKFYSKKKPAFFIHMVRWLLANRSLIGLLSKTDNEDYLAVRYEEFAANTESFLYQVAKKTGLSFSNSFDIALNVKNKHNIAGTPKISSFRNTPVKLDTRWHKGLSIKRRPIIFFFGILCNLFIKIYCGFKKVRISQLN